MRDMILALIAWLLWPFAQSADLTSQALNAAPSWLGPLVGGSFTVWYAWHTTYKTIPALVAENRIEQRQARDDFRAALKDLTDHCEREIAKSEERYTRSLSRLPCHQTP